MYIYICLSTCHPAVLCRLLQVARASRGQARRSLPTAPVSICTFVLAKQEKQVNRIAVLSFQLYCLCRLPHLTCQYLYFCTRKASKLSVPVISSARKASVQCVNPISASQSQRTCSIAPGACCGCVCCTCCSTAPASVASVAGPCCGGETKSRRASCVLCVREPGCMPRR